MNVAQPESTASMIIFVKTLLGKEHMYEVSGQETVQSLKAKVQDITGIPADSRN